MRSKRKLSGSISTRLLPFVVMLFVVLIWQFAISYKSSGIVPGPWDVAKGIVELARKGLLLKYLVASLFRVTWGFVGAVTIGVPLGLFLGWNRRAGAAFNPVIQILR